MSQGITQGTDDARESIGIDATGRHELSVDDQTTNNLLARMVELLEELNQKIEDYLS